MQPLLPSATKLRQGNILTGICQSFCSHGGGGVPPWPDAPRQTPPWTDTPRQTSPHPVHAGIHPLAQCMPGYTPPTQYVLGYTPPCSVYAGIHPLPVATAADSMHPTGMRSCFLLCPSWSLSMSLSRYIPITCSLYDPLHRHYDFFITELICPENYITMRST